jgi:zinc/manganese transport system permease protein
VFSSFMADAWLEASMVAVVAGIVGLFVVMRGSSFVAHAVPLSAFAGAAGASLLGLNILLGLGVFAPIGALGIGWLGRRGRHDVVTALVVALMLAAGSLFLSWNVEYAQGVFSLLFGEVLGVSRSEVGLTAGLGALAVVAVAVLYRPLTLSSVVPDAGEARGVSSYRIEIAFLLVLALATTLSVPVVGSLLMFSLVVGPPAAARVVVSGPLRAMAVSAGFALIVVWAAIALSYRTSWPVGFFVGVGSAVVYVAARIWARLRS